MYINISIYMPPYENWHEDSKMLLNTCANNKYNLGLRVFFIKGEGQD